MRSRTSTLLLLGACAAVAGVGPAVAEGPDRHPVPIRTPAPETPVETAGTGLAPEVEVRVTVDRTGRVRVVEVGDIVPSSEYDELLREVTRETLLRWRYAPRLVGGEPVEATLSWTVAFPTREAAPEEAKQVELRPRPGLSAADSSRFEQRQRTLLTMSSERRVKNLQSHAEVALQGLDESKLRKAISPRFVVYSDAPDERVADIAAGNLEATFNVMETILGPEVAPQSEPFRIVAFLFAERHDFHRLRSQVEGREWAEGFYYPVGMLAFHLRLPSNEALVGVLLHEATHAYLDRYVARPGVVLPIWYHEGLAEYVGNSRIEKGELIPGAIRRFDIYRGPWGSQQWFSGPRLGLGEIKRATRRGEAPTLEKVIAASGTTFYGEHPRTFYSVAWLLVHFLRHGDPAWATERFPLLTLYLAEGFDGESALREVYGDVDELAASFRDYVLDF